MLVDGALWRARNSWPDEDASEFGVGDTVVVERVNGLTLGYAGRRSGRNNGDRALIVLAVIAATVIALASASVRVLREYERGVVFRLGRVIEQKGPGLVLLIPAVDRMVRMSCAP